MSHGTNAASSKSANLLRSKSLTDDQVQVKIKNWKDYFIQDIKYSNIFFLLLFIGFARQT